MSWPASRWPERLGKANDFLGWVTFESKPSTPAIIVSINCYSGFSGGSAVKNVPAVQETWVRSLDQEDPLEKEMATYSSILAWETPWTQEPGRRQSVEWDTT